MCAAYFAARQGADVTVFERNGKKRLGRKIGITGKGRCNLTNNCDAREFLANVPRNPKFLYSSVAAFPPAKVMEWFESAGVPLKTERGNRVFPVSDRATDISSALSRMILDAGVRVTEAKIVSVTATDGGFEIGDGKRVFSADRVIIATGGASYPATGSDGSGYLLAAALGHSVIPPRPSLVPITCIGGDCADMQGLSLKNVGFSVEDPSGKKVYEDFGELLFTHFGISGPVVLSASACLGDISGGGFSAVIDLKPALDEKTLDKRIISDFSAGLNRDFSNSLSGLLPSGMIPVFIRRSGIAPDRKVNTVTKEERRRLVSLFKRFEIGLRDFRPVEEAVITRGGVDVREIDPRTMESKPVPGLYFAGEIIDVDGFTGGFNLQIAWSTGHSAGVAAGKQFKAVAEDEKN